MQLPVPTTLNHMLFVPEIFKLPLESDGPEISSVTFPGAAITISKTTDGLEQLRSEILLTDQSQHTIHFKSFNRFQGIKDNGSNRCNASFHLNRQQNCLAFEIPCETSKSRVKHQIAITIALKKMGSLGSVIELPKINLRQASEGKPTVQKFQNTSREIEIKEVNGFIRFSIYWSPLEEEINFIRKSLSQAPDEQENSKNKNRKRRFSTQNPNEENSELADKVNELAADGFESRQLPPSNSKLRRPCSLLLSVSGNRQVLKRRYSESLNLNRVILEVPASPMIHKATKKQQRQFDAKIEEFSKIREQKMIQNDFFLKHKRSIIIFIILLLAIIVGEGLLMHSFSSKSKKKPKRKKKTKKTKVQSH